MAQDDNKGLMKLRKQMSKRKPVKLFPSMEDILEKKGKGKKGK